MPDEKLAAAIAREIANMEQHPIGGMPPSQQDQPPLHERMGAPAPATPAPPEADGTGATVASTAKQRTALRDLLQQTTWWYPQGRDPVRVAEMDKPWRWNTARFMERRAEVWHDAEVWRNAEQWSLVGGLFDVPDDVASDLLAETPMAWLRRQPLYRAMVKGLPDPQSRRGLLLAARAVHWSTCPMRKAHPGALDGCVCIRNGQGRVTGASNDPANFRELTDTPEAFS